MQFYNSFSATISHGSLRTLKFGNLLMKGAVYIVRAQHRGEGGSRPCTHVHMEKKKRGKNRVYVIENFPLPREFSYCKHTVSI